MAVQITLSKSTCLLLGAALGVTFAFITPSSVDADEKKKQEKYKNAATNTSEINDKKRTNLYGDRTMSEILDKAKSGIHKIWDQGWRLLLMNTKNSSNISSDIWVDAQTSLPKTESQIGEIFDPTLDSTDIDSTMYTPFGKANISRHSFITNGVKKGLNNMAKGYKRANTSRNDGICKNFPRQSTLIETENQTSVEENAVNENTETTDRSNSISKSDKNRKLVLSFRTPFSPVVRVFQAVKKFKRAKKRDKDRNDVNAENNNINDIQKVVET